MGAIEPWNGGALAVGVTAGWPASRQVQGATPFLSTPIDLRLLCHSNYYYIPCSVFPEHWWRVQHAGAPSVIGMGPVAMRHIQSHSLTLHYPNAVSRTAAAA